MRMLVRYLQYLIRVWLFWFWSPALGFVLRIWGWWKPGRAVPIWVYPATLAIGLFAASMKMYHDLEPGRANIRLNLRRVSFGDSGWAGQMPMQPFRVDLTMDMRNSGKGAGSLDSVEIERLDLGTDVFRRVPADLSWHILSARGPGEEIRWPRVVASEEWVEHLRCRIRVELAERDPRRFAACLPGLDVFRIVLRYQWRNLDGGKVERTLVADGTYRAFKQRVVHEWKTKSPELAFVALGE